MTLCEHSHIVYGMVWQMSIYIGLALFTKVSNALNTLISGKKPGFQTLSKGLIHCSPAVRGGCPARSSRPWGRAQRMLGVQQWIADVVCYDCYAQYKTRPIVADVRCVCLDITTGLQKRLNRSRCRLRRGLGWTRGKEYYLTLY